MIIFFSEQEPDFEIKNRYKSIIDKDEILKITSLNITIKKINCREMSEKSWVIYKEFAYDTALSFNRKLGLCVEIPVVKGQWMRKWSYLCSVYKTWKIGGRNNQTGGHITPPPTPHERSIRFPSISPPNMRSAPAHISSHITFITGIFVI